MTSDTASSFHSGAKSGSDLPEQLQQQLRDGTLAAQRKWMLLAKLAMENASKLAMVAHVDQPVDFGQGIFRQPR